jgi:hypothetical protein
MSAVLPLRPSVGTPVVSAEQFFGRDDELEELLELLRGGHSISLAAPRRIGKTSLLRAAERDLGDTMCCVFVDLESCETVEGAIATIAEQAERHLQLKDKVRGWAAWLGGAFGGEVTAGPVSASVDVKELLRVDWQTRASRLITSLLAQDRDVVLFLDELPILLRALLDATPQGSSRGPADLFLSWLRRQTQEHAGRLRVVITGSIGLAPMVARAGLSASLNAYQHVPLGPWSRDTAREALRGLSAHTKVVITEPGLETMLELLGIGVPYHVQLFHQLITQHARRSRLPQIGPVEVRAVWESALLSRSSVELAHWEQRLRKALPADELQFGMRLLTAAAVAEPLTASAAGSLAEASGVSLDGLRAVLDALEHDGYLGRQRDDAWYFPNRLLHAWWVRQHGPFLGVGVSR